MDGGDIEKAIDSVCSLPEEMSQVACQEQQQLQEMITQEQLLQETTVRLMTEQNKNDELIMEIVAFRRRLFLIEDKVSEAEKHGNTLKSDIEKLIQENSSLKIKLNALKNSFSEEQNLFKKYDEKMQNHLKKIQTVQQQNEAFIKMQDLQTSIVELQNKIAQYSTGNSGIKCNDVNKELKEEMESLRKQLCEEEKENSDLSHRLADCKLQEEKYQQEIKVLHKRNAAIFIRLKNQVYQAQNENQQLNKEAQLLEYQIAELSR